jgi:glutathione reductase (NADPH)
VSREFDLIVIGTGSAGSTVAYECNSAGWQVAVVDSRPFGGTCQLRGCDPKKVLVGAADLVDWNRRMKGHGLAGEGIGLDWPALMRFKRTFTEAVPERQAKAYAEAGIAAFHGRARFVDRTSLRVEGETLVGRHVAIAAGARHRRLGIPGEEYLTTSTQFLDLDRLPPRIAFVGGGYISFEFAHLAARAGARVQILHRGSRPLTGFDPDLVDQLLAATRAAGIEVHLETAVTGIEKKGDALVVDTSTEEGREGYEADLVVHGAGRVPEIDDLDLDRAGIERNEKGVVVDEYLQSVSNRAVYAAGDAAARGRPLTPVGSLEGRIVASNLLEGKKHKVDLRATPTVVFTIPPLAAVGMQESAAKEAGLSVEVHQGDTSEWYTSRRVRAEYSGYKVLVEKASRQILGAHLLGAQAEEVINLFAMAIRFDIPAPEMKGMLYGYPSSSSDIRYMV